MNCNNNDVLKNFAQKAKRRLVGRDKIPAAKIKVITNEDVDFKNKVETLMAQEEVVTNPVSYLIDDKIFKTLEGAARERYLLSTLDKYNSFRQQLENATTCSRYCMWYATNLEESLRNRQAYI